MAASVEAEVGEALTQTIIQVRTENHGLRKTLKAMQEHMELLTEDVNQKKDMLRTFVSRMESGATLSKEEKKAQDLRLSKFQRETKDVRDVIFTKLENLVQETTVMNIRLKENLQSTAGDLDKMAAELKEYKRLQADAVAARNDMEDELDSIKELLDEVFCNTHAHSHKDVITSNHGIVHVYVGYYCHQGYLLGSLDN